MAKFATRLRDLRKQHKETQQELAAILGISKSSVNMYERGEREPGFGILERLADHYNVSMDYLMGIDYNWDVDPDSRLSEIPAAMYDHWMSLYNDPADVWNCWLSYCATTDRDNGVLDDGDPFPSPAVTEDVIQFHPIGTVAAGYNECAFEEVQEDFIDIPASYLKGRPRSDYFLLKVKGDSMYPLYHDGDHVLVLKQDSLERPGEIGVVLYDGDQATLKKVEFGDGWMRLVPINPTYKELMIEKDDLNRCRILGIPRVLVRDM